MLLPAKLLNFTGEINVELSHQGDKADSYLLDDLNPGKPVPCRKC